MSQHSVNIIEIDRVLPHGNAERLEIVPIGGWQAVVRKGEFKRGDRAIYVEPDYVVPTALPEFSFLHKPERDSHRLKAVRLRGTLSYGLLIPVPERLRDRPVGSNVMEDLGVVRYEPPLKAMKLQDSDALPEAEWPQLYAPKFDVENLQKWPAVFAPGEPVIATEKLDGGNARYVFHGGQMYIGSRSQWLKNDGEHMWKRAFDATTGIEAWCRANPNVILVGEVYGWVQSLRYGARQREVWFAAFAALDHGQWVNLRSLHASLEMCRVPAARVVYDGPYDLDAIRNVAEQDSGHSSEPGHMMEGVVITPEFERTHPDIGRVCLKLISNRFWLGDE